MLAAGLPPADGVVCFDGAASTRLLRRGRPVGAICYRSIAVRAVGCGTFALWSLPPTPDYTPYMETGYCLAA